VQEKDTKYLFLFLEVWQLIVFITNKSYFLDLDGLLGGGNTKGTAWYSSC